MSLISKYWESQEEIKKRQNDLKFDLTPEEITKLTEESIDYSKKIQDEVANEKAPNFINVVKKLEDLNAFLGPIVNSLTFMQHVSTDKVIREASSESEKKLEAFDIESNLREDVYANVVKVRDLKENLDEIDKRLLEKTLQDYERNGLGLEKEKREQYKEMKTKISELCNKFQQNLNEDTTKVIFTEKELEGCTKDFLEGLTKDEKGDYIVSLKYPELFPTLLYAKNPETRKKLYLTNASNCNKENIPILQEVAELRHKCANLMGYETHSDYVLEIRMAKSRKHVLEFLNGLFEKLKPSALKDLDKFLEFKKQDDPNATVIEPWDFRYYNRLRLERDYGVDDDFIKDYFPMEVVTEGMLKIYQKILSLRFEKLEKAHVWHEDVVTYGVYDKQTNNFLGHFYLDLFPREGKYGHAAAFPLQRTFEIEKGGKRKEIAAAMVANFTKATKDKPSLLKFDEVETYFHEFGHIMHNLCSTARYARMSGTSVERDFVEAPSQMLENWCYQEQVLDLLSGHYQDHNKKLPSDVVQKLKTTKNCSVGILNTRQLFFGIFDQTLHSQGKSDLNHLWSKLTEEVFLIKDDTQFGNPAANFGHLVGGYDAQYYGYLYSEVFSDDMFVNKFLKSEEGVLSEKVGLEYRNHILAPGGSRDSMESLKLFLGREPDQKAFLINKGLQVSNL